MLTFVTPDRINEATERDIRDRHRLGHIHDLVAKLLDELLPDAHDLEHPDARWQPDDLLEVLMDQAKSIRWELARVTRGALVLGDY